MGRTLRIAIIVFYTALFLFILVSLGWTLYSYPLFPLQTDSLEWSNTWLLTTVIDFYGSTICLCGIIIASSNSWISGMLWTVGCCLLGSPVCCLWILYQIVWLQRSSLALVDTDRTNSDTTSTSRGGENENSYILRRSS